MMADSAGDGSGGTDTLCEGSDARGPHVAASMRARARSMAAQWLMKGYGQACPGGDRERIVSFASVRHGAAVSISSAAAMLLIFVETSPQPCEHRSQ